MKIPDPLEKNTGKGFLGMFSTKKKKEKEDKFTFMDIMIGMSVIFPFKEKKINIMEEMIIGPYRALNNKLIYSPNLNEPYVYLLTNLHF